MYEELMKRLKDKASRFDYDGWVDTAAILEEAADAIETLAGKVQYLIERCDMADKNCAEAVHLGAMWKEAALERK